MTPDVGQLVTVRGRGHPMRVLSVTRSGWSLDIAVQDVLTGEIWHPTTSQITSRYIFEEPPLSVVEGDKRVVVLGGFALEREPEIA